MGFINQLITGGAPHCSIWGILMVNGTPLIWHTATDPSWATKKHRTDRTTAKKREKNLFRLPG